MLRTVESAQVYDYVIVGAGSAGCVLANRLSENPAVQVLLIEAGPRDRELNIRIPAAFTRLFKSEVDWNYHTLPQPKLANRCLFWPRGRVLGGSSSINAQMYVRCQPADYDDWAAAVGDPGWGYAQLGGYFERMERRDVRDGSRRGAGALYVSDQRAPNPLTTRFLDAAVECGLARNDEYNTSHGEGIGYTQVTQRRGMRWSAADGYLKPARKRRNLTVETDAQVMRVLFEGTRAVGVECRKRGVERVLRARETVLSAGAINSPQLLMLSGVGPADDLRALGIAVVADRGQVGEQLQDHLAVPVIAEIREPISLANADTALNRARFALLRRGSLTSNLAEATGFVCTHPGVRVPDLQLIFGPVPFINHGIEEPDWHGVTAGAVLIDPKSRGRIRLTSADPSRGPAIDPHYLTHQDDVRVLLHGVRLAHRILHAPAMASSLTRDYWPAAGIDLNSDAALTEFIAQRAETLYHPVGTCRMGNDAESVVDPQLRVRGVQGLRVVDASVMPKIPRGNTHAPTVLLAERAAELIRAHAAN